MRIRTCVSAQMIRNLPRTIFVSVPGPRRAGFWLLRLCGSFMGWPANLWSPHGRVLVGLLALVVSSGLVSSGSFSDSPPHVTQLHIYTNSRTIIIVYDTPGKEYVGAEIPTMQPEGAPSQPQADGAISPDPPTNSSP